MYFSVKVYISKKGEHPFGMSTFISLLVNSMFVPRAGLEPAQPLLAKGF